MHPKRQLSQNALWIHIKRLNTETVGFIGTKNNLTLLANILGMIVQTHLKQRKDWRDLDVRRRYTPASGSVVVRCKSLCLQGFV